MKQKNSLHRTPSLTAVILTLLLVTGAAFALWVMTTPAAEEPGILAYLHDCGRADSVEACHALDTANAAYKIDVLAEIQNTHARMQATAKRIAKGELTAEAYHECVAAQNCATVPMLPENVDPESDAARSDANARISKNFWSLAESETMNADLCNFIPLCAAALHDKIIVIQDGKIQGAGNPSGKAP